MDTLPASPDTIVIERMIFHLVGPELEEADLLAEFDDFGPYKKFFAGRLQAALKGVKYEFLPISGLRDALTPVLKGKKAFVAQSELLAKQFQAIAKLDNRITAGALIFFIFKVNDIRHAALLKFDDHRVIRYRTKAGAAGRKKAVLQSIVHTFVEDKSAMQKSAILWSENEEDVLLCTDRAGKSGDITDRFREYLGAKRSHSHSELTQIVHDALIAVGRKCKDELPKEIRNQLVSRTRDALKKLKTFDPADPAPLLNAVYGPIDADSNIPDEFKRALKKRKIQDEPVSFDKDLFPVSAKKVRETDEGVRIIYTEENEQKGVVKFEDLPGGKKRVTILTTGYQIDDILADKN
jgi:hypothetical protein